MCARRRTRLAGAIAAAVVVQLQGCAGGPISILQGTVTAGPQCPVQRIDQPCPDQPARVTLEFVRDGQVAARTTSGTDGTYELRLPFGRYSVRTAGGGPPTVTAPREVVLDEPREHVDVQLDTGIR